MLLPVWTEKKVNICPFGGGILTGNNENFHHNG
jgi:hypothetical protein